MIKKLQEIEFQKAQYLAKKELYFLIFLFNFRD